ncbi:MAG: PrgI family protein [bacterium]
MKFTVPQFIDVEDKIFGPLTIRQFLIMLVTCGIMFVTFKLADFALFVLLAVLQVAIGGVLAFLKVNGQPFHFFLLNLIQTFRKPRLRVWDKTLSDADLKAIITAPPPPPPPKRMVKERVSTAKLSELTLVVNTGGVYNPDQS